jgi:outer membrane protein assembly factor BamB
VFYGPGEMVVHEGLVIVGVNGGNVHIYNLDTGELEYTFNSIAKFTSYSIYKNLLWISPIEARNGEKTHVYDLETKGLILTVDMKSDIQIWNEDELVSIEKKFSEPTIFTKIKGVNLLLKN